jgi:hypothetical protein
MEIKNSVRRWSTFGADAVVPVEDNPFSFTDVVMVHPGKTRSCAIDPECAPVQHWEAFIMGLLVFTAFATPYEVSSVFL